MQGFPVQVYKPRGCSRVATDFNKRVSEGLEAPVFDAPVSDVRITVMKWLKQQGADIIVDKPDYVYARCCTLMMGFPDDIAIRLKPVKGKKTVVEMQAELVLGSSDLKVNLNRVKDCISFLNYTRK
jgi:uncharacterized protein (DUF1499 family)